MANEIYKAPSGAVLKIDTRTIELVRMNVGSDGISEFDLPRVKIPAGGGKIWVYEDGLGVPEAIPDFFGVIVAVKDGRVFWQEAYGSGESTPPDCFSRNLLEGHGEPGGDCALCPYNEWGTDPKGGRGKACRQIKTLFLFTPKSALPVLLVIPPSSLKPMKSYMIGLASKGLLYSQVVTGFKLEQAVSNGLTYSVARPEYRDQVPPEKLAEVQHYISQFAAIIEGVAAASITPEDAGVDSAKRRPKAKKSKGGEGQAV